MSEIGVYKMNDM